ncbi:MAG: PHP domain-containing protein, partial [Lachnospiraceae bacterium]|nr:PHP domain-containing protein [Lachnospiraceae bacterium]
MQIEQAIRGLHLPQDLRNATAKLDVRKLTASRSDNSITIHAVSDERIPYGVLRMLSAEIRNQAFADIATNVRISVRSDCIENNDDEQEALRLLLDTIREENAETFRQMYNAVMQSASFFAEGGIVKMTLPGDTFFATAEDGFRKDFTEQMKFWSDRFRGLEIVYTEPENLSETYHSERVYDADEYIAKLIRSRENSAEKNGAVRKPKDLTVRPKQEKTEVEAPKSGFQRRRKLPDDPNVFYGKSFDYSNTTPISLINDPYQAVVVHGQVFKVESRELMRRDPAREDSDKPQATKSIVTFNITDFEDSISVKVYLPTPELSDFLDNLKEGSFVCLSGETEDDKYTKELGIGRINGIRKSEDTRIKRKDNSPKKRVELHCHTQMSDMDAVVDTATIVKRAFEWGHPAIAITDHGVV